MARLKSEEKYFSILDAAVTIFSTYGIEAPTLKIAKKAGVSEGTLFKYFLTKDTLINNLYTYINQEIISSMTSSSPFLSPKERMKFIWDSYVSWGVCNPEKNKVILQLELSRKVTKETRHNIELKYKEICGFMDECIVSPQLKQCPDFFSESIIMSVIDATIKCIIADPESNEAYRESGFNFMWRGLGHIDM